MNGFDKVFVTDAIDDIEFDTIYGGEEDGELIDSIGQEVLFTESGEEKDVDVDDEDEDDVEEGVYCCPKTTADMDQLMNNPDAVVVPIIPEGSDDDHDEDDFDDDDDHDDDDFDDDLDDNDHEDDDFNDHDEEEDIFLEKPCAESVEEMFEYLEEKAHFRFLPKFKEYPELKSMYSTVDEIDDFLATQGEEPSQTNADSIIRVIDKYLSLMFNVSSVITLPMCVFIFPILDHLFVRLFAYLIDLDKYKQAEIIAKKSIAKLYKVKAKTNDPKVKERCQKEIDNISNKLKDVKQESGYVDGLFDDFFNESELDSPDISADLDRLMLPDDECTPQDIRDTENETPLDGFDHGNGETADEVIKQLTVGESADEDFFDNEINHTNSEDISPDSEGALDDGDDIDSIIEESELFNEE